MSHALPAPLYDLDIKRILATAATIAVHVLALMLLLAPMEAPPPAAIVEDPPIEIIYKEKIKPIVPTPPIPIERPRPVTHSPPRRVEVPEQPPVVSDQPDPMATPYVPVEQPPEIGSLDQPPTGPVALAVLEGPAPVYPASAIKMNITGRVLLRIEVDATGHPVSGVIEQSSGSSILDAAALKVVLKKWRFVPAQHGGQPIAATALVPIVFSLD
jgi:protein TonB